MEVNYDGRVYRVAGITVLNARGIGRAVAVPQGDDIRAG